MLGKGGYWDRCFINNFCDVDVSRIWQTKDTTTTVDELEKVERTVYNEAGVSQMQFNTVEILLLKNLF